jgi:hypothetical protein
MSDNCDFFITSNIYINIIDNIKKDIESGKFPQCTDESLLIRNKDQCYDEYDTGKTVFYNNKLELIGHSEVLNTTCIYLTLSEWIYSDNGDKTRIIHFSCGCRANKRSGPYTSKLLMTYFSKYTMINLQCLANTHVDEFVDQYLKN